MALNVSYYSHSHIKILQIIDVGKGDRRSYTKCWNLIQVYGLIKTLTGRKIQKTNARTLPSY